MRNCNKINWPPLRAVIKKKKEIYTYVDTAMLVETAKFIGQVIITFLLVKLSRISRPVCEILLTFVRISEHSA